MSLFTILRDNREQTPWLFEDYPVDVEAVTLNTGDYTIPDLCGHDEENDTYYPSYAIERKTGQDFLHSITHERQRFKQELYRADDWPDPLNNPESDEEYEEPLPVYIEEPYATFQYGRGFMRHREVHPNQVTGTVDSWSTHYRTEFQFFEDATTAEEAAFDALATQYRLLEHRPSF